MLSTTDAEISNILTVSLNIQLSIDIKIQVHCEHNTKNVTMLKTYSDISAVAFKQFGAGLEFKELLLSIQLNDQENIESRCGNTVPSLCFVEFYVAKESLSVSISMGYH